MRRDTGIYGMKGLVYIGRRKELHIIYWVHPVHWKPLEGWCMGGSPSNDGALSAGLVLYQP